LVIRRTLQVETCSFEDGTLFLVEDAEVERPWTGGTEGRLATGLGLRDDEMWRGGRDVVVAVREPPTWAPRPFRSSGRGALATASGEGRRATVRLVGWVGLLELVGARFFVPQNDSWGVDGRRWGVKRAVRLGRRLAPSRDDRRDVVGSRDVGGRFANRPYGRSAASARAGGERAGNGIRSGAAGHGAIGGLGWIGGAGWGQILRPSE